MTVTTYDLLWEKPMFMSRLSKEELESPCPSNSVSSDSVKLREYFLGGRLGAAAAIIHPTQYQMIPPHRSKGGRNSW